ncbi:MAG: DUF503 domain-containing protein [Planctomycetota bacterium]
MPAAEKCPSQGAASAPVAGEPVMYVGALRAEYEVAGARSLKDKRRCLRSLKDRLKGRFAVAVSEVDGQDLWQRAVLGVAFVESSETRLRERMDEVGRYLAREGDMRLLGVTRRVFERVDNGFEDLFP